MAQAIETTNKDTRDLAAGTGQHQVHSVEKCYCSDQKPCYHCKGQHNPATCDSNCHGCGKKGHILKACKVSRSTPQVTIQPQHKSARSSRPQHSLQVVEHTACSDANVESEKTYTLFHVRNQNHPPIINIVLSIENCEVTMEILVQLSL